jgi:hypothetical protein
MVCINNIFSIGDILLNKDTGIKCLIVDITVDPFMKLYLREYNKVMDSLKQGKMISVNSYDDYTIEAYADDVYTYGIWKMIGHEDIETIKYFRLRGVHND